jgi:DNA-binding IclR family transcriptional regulator
MSITTSRSVKTTRQSEYSGVRVIAKAAAVLRALGQHPEGLSIREIGKLIDVPRSTVQRIVDALDQENLVISASPTSGVKLGPALIGLAALVQKFDIAELARPVMVQLVKDLGETVDLAVLDRDKAVVVEQLQGLHRLTAVSAVGDTLPLHCSASGKAVLAMLSEDELDKLRPRIKLMPRTKNTITTWAKLDEEIRFIRRHGVALDNEEYLIGIRAAAAAFRGPEDEVAVLSVPAPTDRFTATEKTITRILMERCKLLQRRLQR